MALIIFDYDGVLADTLDDLLRFGQAACDRLGVVHHVTPADLGTLEVMSFTTYGRACGVPEPLVAEFVAICLTLFAEKQSPPALFPGLREVLVQLSARHQLAVVTTNSANNVRAFLITHGLDGLFQAVYGVDTPGSKAQKIALARERLFSGAPMGAPGAVFMIGDALSDIRAAQDASVTSIAVTWGHQRLEHLLRGNPDHVVDSPQQLVEIIER